MAIEANHTATAHPAAKEGTIFVILIMNLAVGVIAFGTVHEDQVEMVKEQVTRNELTR
jgi:hypothetical protein